MAIKIAVVGATGNVGREMMSILEERLFPADEVFAVASRRSVGREVSYGETTLKCLDIEDFDFSKVNLCAHVRGRQRVNEWSPKIAAKGVS